MFNQKPKDKFRYLFKKQTAFSKIETIQDKHSEYSVPVFKIYSSLNKKYFLLYPSGINEVTNFETNEVFKNPKHIKTDSLSYLQVNGIAIPKKLFNYFQKTYHFEEKFDFLISSDFNTHVSIDYLIKYIKYQYSYSNFYTYKNKIFGFYNSMSIASKKSFKKLANKASRHNSKDFLKKCLKDPEYQQAYFPKNFAYEKSISWLVS